MRTGYVSWVAAWVALTSGCRAPAPPAPQDRSDPTQAERLCRALHDAPAADWGARLPPVLAIGGAAEQALLALVAQRPGAAGAQASVAALGRVGDVAAVEACRALVAERGPLAVEAALALGTLPTTSTDPELLACVRDPYTGATLRTACACSLARHGERDHAPRWVEAVVRAGTPAGRGDERALGVPTKTRWARERYFVQRLLLALGHDDLAQELDTDAPWPALEQLAPRVRRRLDAPAGGRSGR